MKLRNLLATLALGLSFAGALEGCSTDAFCFRDCEDNADAGNGDASDAANDYGGFNVTQECILGSCQQPDAADACSPTNNSIEICDGIDNDCNGKVDDVDTSKPEHCGNCSTNCNQQVANAAAATCSSVPTDGGAGVCDYTTCAPDYYDLDHNRHNGCEYFCVPSVINGTAVTDETDPSIRCDGLDNDCDGTVDEDVNLCSDVLNCGACGHHCNAPHGTPVCSHTGSSTTCDDTNTACQIGSCDTGYVDLNHNIVDGCEYACAPTNGGVEICDGLDNDCDGVLDDNLTDTGASCQGGGQGVCADSSHAGTYACVGAKIVCAGAAVVFPGQNPELCNGLDDDCNGKVDDFSSATVGGVTVKDGDSCGSGTGSCQKGTYTCQSGHMNCVGAIGPTTEICDGADNDCDGIIDDNVAGLGVACGSSGGACGSGGTVTCQAGTIVCVLNAGAKLPSPEVCDGIDNDCNGVVDDNVPGDGDPCGYGGGTCKPGTKRCVNGQFSCSGGTGPGVEICNGVDDDCNGLIDDNVQGQNAPCGSNVGACKQGLEKCVNAAFTCVGRYDGAAETCNGIDDDCDGVIDGTAETPNVTCNTDADCVNEGSATSCLVLSGSGRVCSTPPGDVGGSCGPTGGTCVAGAYACISGQKVCKGGTGPTTEVCDGKDNDCNGKVDDNPQGAGAACGTNVGACSFGTKVCTGGSLVCSGGTSGSTETCNGIDDDCDGVVDGTVTSTPVNCTSDTDCAGLPTAKSCLSRTINNVTDKVCATPPSDVGNPCNVPPTPPNGVTSACKAGAYVCVGGSRQCLGSVVKQQNVDACGIDSNCDGQLTGQPDINTDPKNCGSCGYDCAAHGDPNVAWTCVNKVCKSSGCKSGHIDCDSDPTTCETACTFVSAAESCNGKDDNCNCKVDEAKTGPSDTAGLVVPSAAQVCGSSFSATDTGCTTGVAVSCVAGAWQCVFPSGYCGSNGTTPVSASACAATSDTCDGKDNNCNGVADEPFKRPARASAVLNDPCTNGLKGACLKPGTYVCNGTGTDTQCSQGAVTCAQTGGCTELCDGIDNDCDGSVDEPFSAKGTNPTYYVQPAVTQVAASLWVYSYEASRASASTSSSGSGNGYFCSAYNASDPNCNDNTLPVAPSGTTLDKTYSCSVPTKIPWFNATPAEAEQTCKANGGHVCTTTEWQTACVTNPPGATTCKWGYAPNGAACTASYSASDYCNLGMSFDFDANAAGIQNGLLVTGSAALKNCYADWAGLQGNTAATNKVYDITGNLREITKSATNTYPLMGGAFDSQSEDGAQCSFSFYKVDQTFALYDTGFRCCFSANPD